MPEGADSEGFLKVVEGQAGGDCSDKSSVFAVKEVSVEVDLNERSRESRRRGAGGGNPGVE